MTGTYCSHRESSLLRIISLSIRWNFGPHNRVWILVLVSWFHWNKVTFVKFSSNTFVWCYVFLLSELPFVKAVRAKKAFELNKV